MATSGDLTSQDITIRLVKMGCCSCKVVTKGVENKKGACDSIVTTLIMLLSELQYIR